MFIQPPGPPPFGEIPAPGPVAFENVYPFPGAPLSGRHLPRASIVGKCAIFLSVAIDMCLCYRHEIKHIRQVLTELSCHIKAVHTTMTIVPNNVMYVCTILLHAFLIK